MKKIKRHTDHSKYPLSMKYKKTISYCKNEKHIHYDKSEIDLTRLRYIGNSTNAFIDTSIIPDSQTGVYLDFMWTDPNTSSDTYMFGLRDTSGNTRWTIGINPNRIYYGYGGYDGIFNFPQSNHRYQVSLNFCNDKKFKTNTDELNLPTLSFTPVNNIRIFGSSGVQASYSHSKIRIYKMQISQGNEIIMNLVPIKINETGCMFDTISETVLYPQNGTFVMGSEI